MDEWDIERAKNTYGVDRWGNGYFDVNQQGEVVIKNPFNDAAPGLSLMDVISGLQDRDLHMPALLRIENVIDHSISKLNETFSSVIERLGYKGNYRGVFPIKVNQQAQIVEEVAQFGARYNHGFEVGSKPEMIAALSTLGESDQLLICNGYKDQEFVDLALQAVKLGKRCFVVIEAMAELPIIIERSKALGIEPLIGVRAKMTSRVGGHWNSTSGDRSVFGLSSSQIIQVVDVLKANDMLHCLQLLHCHLGSQIPNIRDIRGGVNEACRYYADLCREGAAMNYIDLGGGLAVDYTGAHSQESQSRNYSLQEYCEDVVETIISTLDHYDVKHPTIVTESGRAIVAYSSILLFNVLDVTRFEPVDIQKTEAEDDHELIENLRGIFEYLRPERAQECYNDAHYYRDEVRERFKRGQIGLRTRAVAENLFLEVLLRLKSIVADMEQVPMELEGFDESLADIYYGNFSLFQSLPDTWAIEQMFPVMPVHRLDEAPDRRTVLADITCDCDGKIDRFIAADKEYDSTLPVHSLKDGEEYYLGVFLVGAYQETLGDLHNLFGDTNVASIRLREDGGYEFVKEIHGDTIEDVLGYVEYQPWEMKLRYRNKLEAAVNEGRITARERQEMMNTFNASMQGYTYYEKDHLL